ncbi:hypothetical protein BCR35DRAFT_189644 [Leucosporidium creatinivorum]|uniref:Transferase n=1 Tax=Leucosporidium creatinivorum TaxID=106004 RepID=A0A1Y2FY56_9BASI|nr:hypothetical protein BCR35DRAFT_189644 [Leucosporidium creatinivorum]
MTSSSPSLAPSEQLFIPPPPSLLASNTPNKIPLSPITLWPIGTIPSVHVFPGKLDLKRLKRAVREVAELYPVVCGRLRWDEKEEGEWWIDLTQPSSIPLTLSTSPSTRAFPTPSVLQPSLSPYSPPLDPTQLNTSSTDPLGVLLSLQLTYLPNHTDGEKSVLGLNWGHVLGDGASFCEFVKRLGRAYERDGASASEEGEEKKPNFGPHVVLREPSEEVLNKWESGLLWPTFPIEEGWEKYTSSAASTEVVQLVFSHDEIKLLQSLARGKGEDEWVSEQDAMSSYFVNLLRLCGEEVESVVNSVNYRTFFPSQPSFPPTLPDLVANVAQMLSQPLPSPTTPVSLAPIALSIRSGLTAIRADPDLAVEWLSCRAWRMRQAAEKREMQVMLPSPGEAIVNSNWRYDWNVPFGFSPSQTSHHTAFSIKNFLRVFRTNPEAEVQGAEWTFNVGEGVRERVQSEVQRDRKEGWGRWK